MDQHFHILLISPGVALPLVLHRRRLLLLFHPQSSRFSRISLRLIFPSSARRECASAHLLIPAVRLCCHFPFVRLFYPPLQYLFPHQLASSFDFNIPSLSHCLRTSASFWYDVFFFLPSTPFVKARDAVPQETAVRGSHKKKQKTNRQWKQWRKICSSVHFFLFLFFLTLCILSKTFSQFSGFSPGQLWKKWKEHWICANTMIPFDNLCNGK